ncbi:MAG TPA: DivIVA domain-containing protein [Acidimicrobiales bacterium]|nr:DivIVA domain-containing protein [Acidimicrobiales bacterium]
MDASQSALDSLRTVEFRETLKGYHRDDVDEYLEKAAVEAEGLQEQLRQSGERLRQAAERISQLEAAIDQQPAAQPSGPVVADDSLQRTLLLAQKFVDETKADSEAQAAKLLAEAEAKSRMLTEQAQAQASQIANESEQRLRDEIHRLEDSRNRLSREVDGMSRHLESERNRLRTALGDILRWVDQNVHPAAPQDAPPSEVRDGSGDAVAPASPAPATVVQGGNRPAVGPTQVGPAPRAGTGPSGEVTQMRPTGSNAPLPL